MADLHVEAEGHTTASPGAVWALVADANTYAVWGPWDEGGYRPADPGPSQVGMVPWFRSGRTTSVEKILEVEEGHRIVYTVTKGIPVRNYRAVITVTEVDGGTHLHWEGTWDRTVLGRIVHRGLLRLYPDIVSRVLTAAEAST